MLTSGSTEREGTTGRAIAKAVLGLLMVPVLISLSAGIGYAAAQRGKITYTVTPQAPQDAKSVRLWFPYPVSDDYQRIENVVLEGNYTSSALYREPESGAFYLYADWLGTFEQRSFEMRFTAEIEERAFPEMKDVGGDVPVEILPYLESTELIPTGGEVRKIADEIVKGKKGILEKAEAVYDWVVANTYRDPNVKGCGLGIVEQMLAKRGGKCVDISTLYVALARAAGVPARDIFGLRVGQKASQDITKGIHCWAEFYLPGTGWVPVDPADVRKIMLKKDLALEEAGEYRDYFFGSVDQYHLILEREARNVTFIPPQEAGPLNYFMYPYAEVDGEPLDYFDPEAFSYSIHFEAEKISPARARFSKR